MSGHLENDIVGPRKEVIVVVDDNERFLSTCRRWLRTCGFQNVKCVKDSEGAVDAVETLKPDVILVDIDLGQQHDGLDLLQTIRRQGFRGLAVVVSGDSSKEQCFRAAKAGANDFLLKGTQVKIGEEVERILHQASDPDHSLAAASLAELGYLRSFGLTPREIEILEAFARDFASQKMVADRVDAAPAQIRKAFTRIYRKLGVETSGQLIHILTVCSMFDSRK